MALEEELQLDLSPALESIRGELTRAIEDIPANFRSLFDDQLQGVVSDFGAAAELAREEIDKVFGVPVDVAPVDVPVEVDTAALDELPDQIDAAGQPVDVPVEVDDSQIGEAKAEVEALDGETVNVLVEADTSSLADAQDQVDALAGSLTSAGAAGHSAGAEIAGAGIGVKSLSSAFGELGGSTVAVKVAQGGLVAAVGLMAEKAIAAQAATHSYELRVGDLADTLNRVDVSGLNTSLSDLAVQVGASGNQMRLALARFVQLSEGSGKTRAEIGGLGQSLSALSAYLSVTNPQLGTADEIIQRLPTALARGGRFLSNYGITLTTTEIQQRALADNVGKTAAELTIFDKSAAGLALAMEKYGDRLKSGISEGSELAEVRIRSLRAEVNKAIVAGGKPLIGPVLDTLEAAQPLLLATTTLVGKLGAAFAGVLAPALKVVAPIAETIATVLDKIPKPLLEVGAAIYLTTKAFGLLDAGLTLAARGVAATTAAFSAETSVLAAHDAAVAAAAAATQARVIAEAELLAANVSLSVSDGALIGLQVDVATAQAAVITTTVAETAALEGLAVASEAATVAIAPLVAAAVVLGAVFYKVTQNSRDLHLNISQISKATSAELVKLFDKFAALGLAGDFFKQLAGKSTESATQLRDALAAQGRDVTEYTAILDEAAKHEKDAARDKALAADETKKLTEALSDADPAVRSNAAETLKLSLAYEGLAPDVRKAVDAQVAMDAANEAAKKAAEDNAAAVQAQADAANNATTAFDNAVASLSAYLGLAVDQQGQGLKFAITLDELKAKQDDFTKSRGKGVAVYALETTEGRKNIDTLIGIVEQQAKIAANNIKADASPAAIERTTAKYRDQVDALRKVAAETGLTQTQFDGLLKQYGLLPEQLDTAISITGVDEAKEKADGFKSDIEKLPIEVRVTTTLNESEIYQKISRTLAGMGPFSVPVNQLDFLNPDQLGLSLNAEGNVYDAVAVKAYAEGGVRDVERYANGEDHTAQIATTMRVFAEPETGGEAYIPLAPAKRERSTAILGDVASRFGYELVPVGARRYADGAVVDTSAKQAWSDVGMIRVLERLVVAVDALPGKIPRGGDTFNVDATVEQQDTLREVAESIVANMRRR